MAYSPWTHEGVSVELSCDYNFPEFIGHKTSNISNEGANYGLMVINGDVYLAWYRDYDYSELTLTRCTYNGDKIETSEVNVSLPSGTMRNPNYALLFVGNDSEGNPYMCLPSYVDQSMELYSIDLVGDNVEATRTYSPTDMDLYSREVSVAGSVVSGDFSLAACYHPYSLLNLQTSQNTGIALWQFKNGVQQGKVQKGYKIKLAYPTVQALGGDYILVDERGYDRSAKNYADTIPTVLQFDGTKYSEVISELDKPNIAPVANGSHIFEFGGQSFIIYPAVRDDDYAFSYNIDYLPDYPYSLDNAETVWTLEETFPEYALINSTGSKDYIYSYDGGIYNVNFINTIPQGDDKMEIYIFTSSKGLSKYTLKASGNLQTLQQGISVATDATEYYTLTGLRIDRPSAPGIYIERRGSATRKVCISSAHTH